MNFKQGQKLDFIINLAILVSIFLLLYFIETGFKGNQKQGVLVTYWPNPKNYKDHPEIWGELPPKRNYLDIKLTGDDSEDKIKLKFAQLQIRQILREKDSLAGIHFMFGKNAKYWTFIKAIDVCKIEKAPTYIPHNNNLWLFYSPLHPRDTSNQIKEIYL